MRSKDFMSRLDHERLVAAIADAEARTSGEIRVYVQRGKVEGDPLALAQRKFLEFGMEKTAARNAILFLVAPRAQKFAVVGDEGIHQKCGSEFWNELTATMRAHFQREKFTDALSEAIATAGKALAAHFPRQPDDRNELPDIVLEN